MIIEMKFVCFMFNYFDEIFINIMTEDMIEEVRKEVAQEIKVGIYDRIEVEVYEERNIEALTDLKEDEREVVNEIIDERVENELKMRETEIEILKEERLKEWKKRQRHFLNKTCFKTLKGFFSLVPTNCSFCKEQMRDFKCKVCNNEWKGFDTCLNVNEKGKICNASITTSFTPYNDNVKFKLLSGMDSFCDSCFFEIERYIVDETDVNPYSDGDYCLKTSDRRVKLCRKNKFEEGLVEKFIGFNFCIGCYCEPTKDSLRVLMDGKTENLLNLNQITAAFEEKLKEINFSKKIIEWLKITEIDSAVEERLLNAKFVHEYCKQSDLLVFPDVLEVMPNYSSEYKYKKATNALYEDLSKYSQFSVGTSQKDKRKRNNEFKKSKTPRGMKSPRGPKKPDRGKKKKPRRRAIDNIQQRLIKLVF